MQRKTDIVREYRGKYPDYPNLKLARIIYDENGKLFASVDSIRTALRAIEGKNGKTRIKATHQRTARPYNPYKLPESDEAVFEPYLVKHNRIALLSDIHVPYHSVEAITTTLDYLKKWKPTLLLLNGDFFDFHGLSRFLKDPRKKNFAEEIEIGCQLLNIFKKELGCEILFKLGNHDERYQHYLWMKMGELGMLDEWELSAIINRRVPGVKIVDGKRIIKAGKLSIVHGHEFGGSIFSPVNIARGFFLRAKETTIGGHHHRVSSHSEKTASGDIIKTWSTGCLSELNPAYLPINSWAHGFATVEVFPKGHFHVNNIEIYKGKIL